MIILVTILFQKFFLSKSIFVGVKSVVINIKSRWDDIKTPYFYLILNAETLLSNIHLLFILYICAGTCSIQTSDSVYHRQSFAKKKFTGENQISFPVT